MALVDAQQALRRIRAALIVLGAAATVLALTGVLAHELFRRPTTLKYIVSVLAPLALLVLATSERPLRLLVGAIIASAPFGTLETTFSGIATPLAAVLIAAAAVVAVVKSPLRGHLSSIGFAGLAVALLLTEPILAGTHVRFNVLWLAAILAVAWLVALTASEPGGKAFVCGAVVLGVSVQAVIALYELHTGRLPNLYGTAGSQAFGQSYFFTYGTENRPIGSFNDPISLGNVLALALPLYITLAHAARGWLIRLAIAVAGGVTAVALVVTLSRMSWIGGAVGVAVTLALLPRGPRAWSALVVAAMLVAAVAIGGAAAGQNIDRRAASILHPTSSTSITAAGDIEREHIWSAALSIFRHHPVVGVGLDNIDPLLAQRTGGITQYSHAHSTYFQALAEAGICGALALLVAWLSAGAAVVRGLRRPADRQSRLLAAGLAGSGAAILIGWVTDYTVHQISVGTFVATFFGLAACLLHARGHARGAGTGIERSR